MGWIFMQPAKNDKSKRAMRTLWETIECLFDLSKNGARLKPIAFGSRLCTDFERKYHLFVGETVYVIWEIVQERHLLWGQNFWWICDCASVKEVLLHKGSISFVCCWAQEFIGYQFQIVHRSNKIMVDVDAVTRRFGTLIAHRCMIASIYTTLIK